MIIISWSKKTKLFFIIMQFANFISQMTKKKKSFINSSKTFTIIICWNFMKWFVQLLMICYSISILIFHNLFFFSIKISKFAIIKRKINNEQKSQLIKFFRFTEGYVEYVIHLDKWVSIQKVKESANWQTTTLMCKE